MSRHTCSLTTWSTGPLGAVGEDLAVDHLRGDDRCEVVARNWRLRSGAVRGELDIVALDHLRGMVLVVEVKTRSGERHGGPLVAVTAAKQRRIRRLTSAFLREAELPLRRVRFDVVGVLLPPRGEGRLEHLEGAF